MKVAFLRVLQKTHLFMFLLIKIHCTLTKIDKTLFPKQSLCPDKHRKLCQNEQILPNLSFKRNDEANG